MKLSVCFIVFSVVLYVGASDPAPVESKTPVNGSMKGINENGIELLLAKLEAMEHKFEVMQNELRQYQSSQEQNRKETFAALQKLDHDVALVSSLLKPNQSVEQQDNCITPMEDWTTTEDSFTTMEDSTSPSPPTSPPMPLKEPPFSSCRDAPHQVSGVYQIRVKNDSAPFQVYCEQKLFDGGWIVIQHRYDGSLDFYLDWDAFRDGFGNLAKEFWLGLEKIHQITKGRRHELLVEIREFNGIYAYARYDAFEVGSEDEQFALKELGKYSGTAGDGMSDNRGKKFSTKDRDNDGYTDGQCAHFNEGAWWHSMCTHANLNGPYRNARTSKNMFWYDFIKNHHGLSFSRMMIREQE
ncbi:angiopoietin-related protein 1-like [Anopheles aquasalis]|uniref:angiopoietin-related protein 1-like n=1 Tax=Anopheles aquasalis TaxID=42839 RepID=UPI00215AF3D8|nr:angiopoietin-related protein 1-like [Anopheles aquasalis]